MHKIKVKKCNSLLGNLIMNFKKATETYSIVSCSTKGQIKSEWIYKSSIFQISNSKIRRISALKVYLKLNQKVVRVTLSTNDKPSLNMQKKIGQIVLYLQIFNFKTFRARNPSNFGVANLENRWLYKFILTLSDL